MEKCRIELTVEGQNFQEVYKYQMDIGFDKDGKLYLGEGQTLEDTLSNRKASIKLAFQGLESGIRTKEMRELESNEISFQLK